MAYVLSVQPQSPLKRSFSDNPYLQSCSALRDLTIGTLYNITPRNASECSLYSLGPTKTVEWFHSTENTPPPLTSRSLLDLPERGHKNHGISTDHIPLKQSCDLNHPTTSFPRAVAPSVPYAKKCKGIELVNESPESHPSSPEQIIIDSNTDDDTDFFNLYDAIHIPLPEGHWSDNTSSGPQVELEESSVTAASSPQPFRRWMSTLRRRHIQRHIGPTPDPELPDLGVKTNEVNGNPLPPLIPISDTVRRLSVSITSSMDCVTAIKPSSITIASAKIAPFSDAGGLHGKDRLGNRSSHYSEARRSTDSHGEILGPIMDESAWLRSVQRRKIAEELISSEESYIADLKVLINDYFVILTGVPALQAQTRASIQQNTSQILQLHEDLLTELHQAVPQTDYIQTAQQEAHPVTKAKHIRFHSADLMPSHFFEHKITRRIRHSFEIGRSPDRRPQGLITDTKMIGDIARIFNKHMKRFFAYEEYGAHWTTMSQDLTSTCRNVHGWQEYERGIEALSKVVASENNRITSSRKALSFADLLIKPIQRVCKYPLLFDDLCRHTPVYDDPEAHTELEKALFRLQETIREVNKAKDDPKTRRLIEITWQLQDRLVFQEQTFSRALIFRLLGHVLVCGVLHVTFQTPERPKGQYMICVLYKSCLVLATASRFFTPYTVVACIVLANGSIEEPDNGRGLQCHTAPHTWKLMFEHGHRLHEVILSACSSQEEAVWKKQLCERIVCETHDLFEGQSTMHDMFSSLSLDIKSLGPVFGYADSLVRRMSVHRAATLGAKQHVTQVIIKNTQAQKPLDRPPNFAPNLVTRSQSHMSASHVPTLAPRQVERIRLENALEELWTKDILPFPGMGNRRVENQIRASANSVMRKLSMASIASNFSRRSPSFSSISNTRSEDSFGSRVHKISQGNLRARSTADRRPAPAVVDFHNAPAAFLPTDFELQNVRPSGRRRRLANRAIGTEHCSDRGLPNKSKRTRRLSSHISLPRTNTSSCAEIGNASIVSQSTMLGPGDHANDTENRRDGDKQKRKDSKDRNRQSDEPSGSPPAKKFLKSRSRIFRFWA